MANTSENSSPVSRIIAAAVLLALLVAGTLYIFPSLWKHAAKNSPAAETTQTSAPSIAIHPDAPKQSSPIISAKPIPPAPKKSLPTTLTAALQQIPASPTPNNPKTLAAKNKKSDNNDFLMQPDSGIHDDAGGETGEDPKQRADYFYRQRAYPFDQTPAGALQQSRQQLDAMVTQQRAMGILPAEGAVQDSVGFPGPANWTNLGPQPVTNSAGGANFGNPASTGRVTAIAVDPTTTTPGSQIVYLGAATGGVWKSTDGGTTWNTIFDQNNSLAIGGIAIAPTDHNTIYVGTGELNFSQDSYYGAGIYKSTDGGTTWTQQCGPSGEFCNPIGSFPFQGGGFIIGRIAVSPANASVALAAVRDAGDGNLSGIYRTTDGGTTWALVPTAAGSAGNSVVWNPTDSTVVYATLGQTGTNPGVFKSTDGGATFTKLTGSLPNLPTTNIGRHELALAPSNPSVIYVAVDNNDQNSVNFNSLLGLAKSTNAGATWTFTTTGTFTSPGPQAVLPDFCHNQCWYDMALAVHPTDPNTLIVGGSAFTNNNSTDFRSSDGGTTWVDITSGSTAVRPHVDTHVLTFAATTSGFRLYTGNDGGVWFSDNPTATAPITWQPGNNANLTITQFYPGHAVHPSDENISFGGTQDNGTEKYSGIPAWDHVTCGDGAWAAIDPVFPTTVYANCQNVALFRSDFDGTAGTWFGITNQIPSSGERSLFIPPLVQDQNQSGRAYFGTFRVWQSMDYGNDWSVISPDLTSSGGNEVTSVSVAQSNNNVVYATTTDGRVWRTTNAGAGFSATWTNLTKAPLPNRYATMVRTDFGNSDIAYISYSGFNGFSGDTVGHIFKTVDGGTTWTDISGTAAGALPNTPVNDIAVAHIPAPLNFDAVFIGTDVGVFECANPTAATPCQTWTPVGTGLPKVPVVGLAWRQASATLRAVTHGRGVWVIETPGINPTGLLLLTSISPSSKAAGAATFTMTLDGNDFGQPSGTPVILVDGAPAGVAVLTINATEITATIPASVMTTPGLHQISVSQPGHALNPSNPTGGITFSVTGLAPTLTIISPTTAAVGGASFPLTVTGNNFVCASAPTGSVVQFGSNTLVPSSCSATSLTVTVPSNLLGTPSSFAVRVFNAGPGGGASGSQTFTVGTAAANDNFVNAINIATVPFTNSQNTVTATTEVGEPVPSAACTTGESANTHSVWYRYTPLTSGNANFTTAGQSIDGIIQVVTGTLGAFTAVPNGCNDANVGQSDNVTVAVTAGTAYFIMVSDFAGNGGTSVLNLVSGPAPAASTPDMTITKSHTGNFVQGQTGATYSITATNIGTASTTGTVTVVDALPAGLTATGLSGTGWTCTLGTLICTRNDALAAATSYPTITLTVTVAASAAASLSNTATVSGGGETNLTNNVAIDATTILTPAAASLSVNTLAFTNQGVNTTSTAKSTTVTNTGGATLTFTAAPTITGTNAANFAVATGTTCTNGANVAGGATCILNITFTPPSTGSFGPATLTLTDNASPTTQTATLTGTGIDFAVSAATGTASVTSGQTATYTINLTPGTGGFANAITFSATGLPNASTATFNPPSVTPGATAASSTLSVSTTAHGALPPSNQTRPWNIQQFALWSFALASILLGFFVFGKTGRTRRLTPALFVTVALLVVIGITGCGSAATGTPAGTSTITVTATSGTLVHTTTVTLTVQ